MAAPALARQAQRGSGPTEPKDLESKNTLPNVTAFALRERWTAQRAAERQDDGAD